MKDGGGVGLCGRLAVCMVLVVESMQDKGISISIYMFTFFLYWEKLYDSYQHECNTYACRFVAGDEPVVFVFVHYLKGSRGHFGTAATKFTWLGL